MAVTNELSAPDDRSLRFRLAKPFPHLPAALAGSSSFTPCIMPERLARTEPTRQVTEMVGRRALSLHSRRVQRWGTQRV
jgi:peptide/nickel transport system substrate-binding protein